MTEVLSKTNLFCLFHPALGQASGSLGNSVSSSVRCVPPLKLNQRGLRASSPYSDFYGREVVLEGAATLPRRGNSWSSTLSQMNLRIGKAHKWWEKGLQPNMKEVTSANDLVDSLLGAGDKLVVVDFFSPGCGGCKALHPKICQLAETNPDVRFLQVNYEEHKSMCYSLNVHVLPFFRFYRGAEGRLCSFSCTNATIKKFKDALAKHTTDRCSIEPTKGLEEKELLALAANRELSFNYTPKRVPADHVPAKEEVVAERSPVHSDSQPPHPLWSPSVKSAQVLEEKNLVSTGR